VRQVLCRSIASVVLVALAVGCSDDVGLDASAEEITFLQRMDAHHAQAVQLAQHEARHGSDEHLRDLALQIAVAQAHEQGEMQALLVDREATVDPTADHAGMRGMIPADRLAAALQLDGTELDAEFVRLMIDHHQGAVAVANDARANAELSEPVRDLAGRIATDQQEEITELELFRG
jgi:uncharacterized protein (DUF305 family)